MLIINATGDSCPRITVRPTSFSNLCCVNKSQYSLRRLQYLRLDIDLVNFFSPYDAATNQPYKLAVRNNPKGNLYKCENSPNLDKKPIIYSLVNRLFDSTLIINWYRGCKNYVIFSQTAYLSSNEQNKWTRIEISVLLHHLVEGCNNFF